MGWTDISDYLPDARKVMSTSDRVRNVISIAATADCGLVVEYQTERQAMILC